MIFKEELLKARKLIHGVGVNDDPSKVTIVDSRGKRVKNPYYERWYNMLGRCYSDAIQKRQPTYVGCTVDERWHKFSSFKAWMITQDWQGNDLDKDLLHHGNKVYGPETCVFIHPCINRFFNQKNRKIESSESTGVHNVRGKYVARIRSPLGDERLGVFDTNEAASIAYMERKRELARDLAACQTDMRVREALLCLF